MKRFRFTLEPVATLRNLQEMRARDGFATAVRQVATCAATLAQQQMRVTEFVAAVIDRRSTGLPASFQVSFLRAYAEEVNRERLAGEALAQAERQRESARQYWVDTLRQVKLVDKLRSRARERHLTESSRFDQRQLDDRAPRGALFLES
jgi:flagellar export protein FliJ